ncbi:MAG: gamma-glutamyltransferase, partial [Thermoplasmata archaeon]
MNFDPLYYPYESRRTLVYGNKGMVCSSQPLAAQAGLEILKKGGNAVDAAVATAAALTAVEPTSNGIGGDCFALFWNGKELKGLNSSGPSPKNISIEKVKDRGYEQMPKHGWIPVTVPGVPAGWAELVSNEGELTLNEVLKPAVEYAEEGHPVSPTVGKYWKFAYNVYSKLEGDQFK